MFRLRSPRPRYLALVGFALTLALTSFVFVAPSAHAAPPYSVTTNADDGNPNCVTELSGGIVGSLRFEICQANTDNVGGLMTFLFPMQVQPITTPLPTITDAGLSIDGSINSKTGLSTCPDPRKQAFPAVQIDGALLSPSGDGLTVALGTQGVTIKGLSITRFSNGIMWGGDKGFITCNWLGVDSSGVPAPNGYGLQMTGSVPSSGGHFGGATNIASLNLFRYNYKIGASLYLAYSNIFDGNNADYNGYVGYYLNASDANQIRGAVSASPGSAPIYTSTIVGNRVGGIDIVGSSDNMVGEPSLPLATNYIEKHSQYGVRVEPGYSYAASGAFVALPAWRNSIRNNNFGTYNGTLAPTGNGADIDLVPGASIETPGVVNGDTNLSHGNNWVLRPRFASCSFNGSTIAVTGFASPLSIVELYQQQVGSKTGGQYMNRATALASGLFTIYANVPSTNFDMRATSTLAGPKNILGLGSTSEFSIAYPGKQCQQVKFPPKPNLTSTKVALNSTTGSTITSAAVGSIYTYRIVVQNTGNINIPDLFIIDNLPAGLLYVAGSETCTINAIAFVPCNNTPTQITAGLVPLAIGDSAVVEFKVQVTTKFKPGQKIPNRVTAYSKSLGVITNGLSLIHAS